MPLRYSAELEPSAIAFLNTCDDDEARRLRDLIEEICTDPNVDEQEKIAVVISPIVFRVLVKAGYWIAYHMQGPSHLWIVAIKRAPDGRVPSGVDIMNARREPPLTG